jgi:hypothetical protein
VSDAVSALNLEEPKPLRTRPLQPLAVYRVSTGTLNLIWPAIKPLLERGIARERGRFNAADVYGWITRGTHQLWVATENGRMLAAIVTEILLHPSGKRTFHLLLAGGSQARRWIAPAFARMREYARVQGATEARMTGRKGWLRHLHPLGFHPEAVILILDEV